MHSHNIAYGKRTNTTAFPAISVSLNFIVSLSHSFVTGGCFFPERWVGTWFQSGVRQPIIIEGPRLSSKGMCLGSEGDKFLVVDE